MDPYHPDINANTTVQTYYPRRNRNIAAGLAVISVIIHLIEHEESAVDSLQRGHVRASLRGIYIERRGSFLDCEFIMIYRMKRSSMEVLRNRLFPFLQVHLSQSQVLGRSRGNRRPLTVDEKVGIGLMCAGGCTIAGIIASFHVGKSCAFQTEWQFFLAIVQSYIGQIVFPKTLYEMMKASDAFMMRPNYCKFYHGCMGALDGLACRITMPSTRDCENPIAYKTRKGFTAVNVQAIADGRDRCIACICISPGSTHDSTAWSSSKLYRRLTRTGCVVDPRTGRTFWLSMDEAYEANDFQVCPWPGTGLVTRAPYKDSFNYFLSATSRNSIERLFGQLYQRWGILWRPMHFQLQKVPTIIHALFQLHNFVKEMGEEVDDNLLGMGPGHPKQGEHQRTMMHVDGYDHNFHTADSCSIDPPMPSAQQRIRPGVCVIREEITQLLEMNSMLRPNYGQQQIMTVDLANIHENTGEISME